MTDIIKYQVLNPIPDKSKPFVRNGILYIPILEKYRYFLECAQDNAYGGRDYFLLLSKTKFNQSCRICQCDGYGRIKLKLKGEIKDYIYDKCEEEGNCDFEYIESGEDYDVFSIQ